MNDLYEGLSEEALEELKKHERAAIIPSGGKLLEHGVLPENLIIVNSGAVDISVPAAGSHVSLGSAGPGKVFGMRAAIAGETPEINVTCLDECAVTLVPRKEFMAVLQKYPNIYFAVARVLSADLKIADRLIRDCSRRPVLVNRAKVGQRM